MTPESQPAQGDGCTCQNCGMVYFADLLVPDDVWAAISPECNLLCPTCIAERIVRNGIWTAIRGFDVDGAQGDTLAAVVAELRETITRVRDLAHRATSPFLVMYRDAGFEKQASVSAVAMHMLCNAADDRLEKLAAVAVTPAQVAQKYRTLTLAEVGDVRQRAEGPDGYVRTILLTQALEDIGAVVLAQPSGAGK